jgi:hypothetical protein
MGGVAHFLKRAPKIWGGTSAAIDPNMAGAKFQLGFGWGARPFFSGQNQVDSAAGGV